MNKVHVISLFLAVTSCLATILGILCGAFLSRLQPSPHLSATYRVIP